MIPYPIMASDFARTTPADTWGAAWLLAAAALVIGVGSASPEPDVATLIAVLACVLAGVGVLGPGAVMVHAMRRRSVQSVLIAAVLLAVGANLIEPPVADPAYLAALVMAGVAGVAGALLGGRRGWLIVTAALVGQFALACWMIAALELPDIDVYMFHQQALEALLSGDNPYSLRYPNTAGYGTDVYALELQIGDRLAFGFPYPPFSLLLSIPGYLIGGDYRYAAAASVLVTSLLVARFRPGSIASVSALLFAFSPLTFRVLYYGWTETFVVVWLAITMFAVTRLSAGTPIALGLFVAVKQYVAPVLLLAPLLLPDLRRRIGWLRLTVVALVVAGVTVLPFLIWHPRDLLFSVVALQALQPFRLDSASIPAGMARMGLAVPPQWLAFVIAALGLVLVAIRAPRTPAGFSGAVAFMVILFFVFSKQAFANYYFFAFGALACGVALMAPLASDEAHEHSDQAQEG